VGGVLIHEGRVLLIRRGQEPLRGRWMIPGGGVEAGETLEDAIVREIEEETGLVVKARELLTVVDGIHREDGRLQYHFVIIEYLCEYVSGSPRAASDADAVAFVARDELPAYDLTDKALEVVLDGFRRESQRA
jgi:8-oxo-dGTP diphosphatase